MSTPRTAAEVVAYQARACGRARSPLYQRILDGVHADMVRGGVAARLLDDRDADPFGTALALRLLGSVHRIVLEGRAPELAALYPSVGGDPARGDPAAAFVAVLEGHAEEVAERLTAGVQTNEVGRSAALAGGFAEVQARTGLPLRVLELGASAGLNLRFDRYAYDTGHVVAGDPTSPVRFERVWEGSPPPLPARFEVAERRGCDRDPIDPTSDEGRLTLRSYVWADQLDRLARLDAALRVAQDVPVDIDRAEASEWIDAQLAGPRPGVATVVVHSIVLQYLSPERRRRLRHTIADAGGRATAQAPLAWLRMEPATEEAADVRLALWPGGEDRLVATAGYHGLPVRWQHPA